MPKTTNSEKYLICILHNHDGEHSTTIGVIDVGPTKKDGKVAKRLINSWLDKKFKEHDCERYGGRCSVSERPAYSSLKAAMLLASAEPIVPTRKA